MLPPAGKVSRVPFNGEGLNLSEFGHKTKRNFIGLGEKGTNRSNLGTFSENYISVSNFCEKSCLL